MVSVLVAASALALSSPAHALDIDLRTQAGFIVWGADPQDNTGRAVAMGDLDGDGYRDIIIGSIGTDGAGNVLPNSGSVDIIWGDTPGNLGTEKDLLSQSDVHIDGADTGDQVGIFVVSGDFDGDGRADLAIGASLGDGPGNIRPDCGEVYIFYGRDRASWAGITSVTQRDVVVYGADPGDNSGISLATGDVNNDGKADLLIGGSGMDGPANLRGAAGGVNLLWGGPRPVGGAVDLASVTLIDGAEANDLSGRAVACGDLDGDNMDDIIIGVPNGAGPANARAQGGEVRVIWGRTMAAMGQYKDLASDTDLVVWGALAGDNSGTGVWAADHDGDNYADLIIGAPLADGPSLNNCGRVYMVYGKTRASWGASLDLNGGIVGVGKEFIGAESGDLLGNAVTGGDMDGDGKDDIILDATLADGDANGRPSCGEMFMYFGAARASIPDVVTTSGIYDIRIIGADAGDRMGTMMAMGDLDNNGKLELAMGGPGADSKNNARPDAGEVTIIYGFGQSVPALLLDLEAEGNDAGGATVTWSTLQQDEVRGFNVYRILGAGAYEQANGSLIATDATGRYSFVDAGVHEGVTGYEVRQVDLRGHESMLGTVGYTPAAVVTAFAIRNLASPFVGSTTFSLSLPSRFAGQPYRVAMYDNAGRLVKTLATGTVTGGSLDVRMDGAGLRAGVYHVLVTAGGERLTTKVVKL